MSEQDRRGRARVLLNQVLDEWVPQAPGSAFSDRTAQRLGAIWREEASKASEASRNVEPEQVGPTASGNVYVPTFAEFSDRSPKDDRQSEWIGDAAELAGGEPIIGDLGEIWQELLIGRLRARCEGSIGGHLLVIVKVANVGTAYDRLEAAILARTLYGESHKIVAAELGIGCSTVSKRYISALEKLQLHPEAPIPLPLVIAAQSWASGVARVASRRANFTCKGREFSVLSVPRPKIPSNAGLTPSEAEIAELLILGVGRSGIAAGKSTSSVMIASQIRRIFAKLGVVGRFALIRRAAELQWFGRTKGERLEWAKDDLKRFA